MSDWLSAWNKGSPKLSGDAILNDNEEIVSRTYHNCAARCLALLSMTQVVDLLELGILQFYNQTLSFFPKTN
jgi:hypothetical protein